MSASESDSPRQQLARAQRAYEAGDFVRVRELCQALSAAGDPAMVAQAQALRARISVDPVALWVLAAALVLFGVIVHAYVL